MSIVIDNTVITSIVSGIGGAGAALAITWTWVVKPVRRVASDWRQFREDWEGRPARPHIDDGTPGVLVRLRRVEDELKPNSGHSLRDAVDRLEAGMADHVRLHGELVTAAVTTRAIATIPATVYPDATIGGNAHGQP